MRRMPSLKSLQAFEAAARRGSFTAAANELHVTASAISHQIRFLEKDIGLSLFHRETRTIVLTDAGERYFQQISDAFSTMEAATREIERHGKSDILTVHSVPSFAAQWLMPRLSRFSAQHSDIDVRLYASADPVELGAGLVDVDQCRDAAICIRVTGGRVTAVVDGKNCPDFVTLISHGTCYVYGVDGARLKKVEGGAANRNCAALPADVGPTVHFGDVEIRNRGIARQETVTTYQDPSVRLKNGNRSA